MKKVVFASAIALAGAILAPAALFAQDITIKDPAEYAAYTNASSQSDPKAKAAAEETFLKNYPQSVVKASVLGDLLDTYWGLRDFDNTVSVANRLLQVDPNNAEAILYSVIIKKGQCEKSSEAQTCDDAALLAQKGLTVTKPAAVDDARWKQITHAAYPIYDSTIALDDSISKKDYKTTQTEYTAELKLYSDAESQTAGLKDTLLLAQAYSQPGAAQDLVKAVWFYARFLAFAPPAYKTQFEPTLEYYYKKYHGALDGLDSVKQKAATSVFPPDSFTIVPAKSPAEQIHDLVAQTPDLNTLALDDKETILALGTATTTDATGKVTVGDADKMWAVLKDKQTVVPGIVIAVTASQIKVAVSQDARATKVADFIVNLKTPLSDADVTTYSAAGFTFKTSPDTELAGTYDSFVKVPATDTTSAAAQIILRDGEIIPAEKKKPVTRKPSAAHH
jgi:hypothetical protein